jgi:hypothetical protein
MYLQRILLALNRLQLVGLAFLLSGSGIVNAMPFVIRAHGSERAPVAGKLHAVRIDARSEPIDIQVTVPGEGSVVLGDGRWQIALEAPGYWAPTITTAGASVALDAWVTGAVSSRVASRRTFPAAVHVQFTPSATSGSVPPPAGESACDFAKNRLECAIPAGTYDLKIGAKGSAPVFRWNVVIRPHAETILEPVEFRRGASVLGRIALARDAKTSMSRVRVGIRAKGSADSARPLLVSRVSERGLFEFVGITPGDYILQASTENLTSDSRVVHVIDSLVAELDSPLLLSPPRKLTIAIMPPKAPDGGRWSVRLLRDAGGVDGPITTRRKLDEISESPADADGTWAYERIPDGSYVAEIATASGDPWNTTDVRVDGADVRQDVVLAITRVEGTVLLGDRPLTAKVTFGGKHGSIRCMLTSDDHGEFSGTCPAIGSSEAWPIYIHSSVPPIDQPTSAVPALRADGALRFEIQLPRTVVTGVVVHEDGKPERYPLVNVMNREGTVRTQVTGRDDGSFDIVGLIPGVYRVVAEGFLTESERKEIVVDEGDAPAMRLVLKNTLQIPGRIVIGSAPVIGASVTAMQRPFRGAHDSAKTNEAGAFIISFPHDTEAIDIVVKAPGLPLAMRRVALRGLHEINVALDVRSGALALDVPASAEVAELRHLGAVFSFAVAMATYIDPDATVIIHDGVTRILLPRVEPGEYTLCVEAKCTTDFVSSASTTAIAIR